MNIIETTSPVPAGHGRAALDRLLGRQIASEGRIPRPGSSAALREGWHNFHSEARARKAEGQS
jgi:hypothetical protein